jgi:hypothetical protein
MVEKEETENSSFTAALLEMRAVVNKLGRRANLIHYLVPHREQDLTQSSPLQGFTPDVPLAAPCYAQIATLPKSIPELMSGNHGNIAYRMVSEPYAVFPVQIDQMQPAFELLNPFCSCIWSSDDEIAAVTDSFITTREEPILHVSPSGYGNSLKEDDVKRITIRNHILRLLEYRAMQGYQVGKLVELIRANNKFEVVNSDLPYYGHLITQPNELTLQAVGFEFERNLQLLGVDNDPYFDALRSQLDPMCGIRTSFYEEDPEIYRSVPYELIVTSPSILKHIRALIRNLGRDLSPEERRHIRFVLRQMIGRGTYPFVGTPREVEGMRNDPHVQGLLSINSEDLRAYTAALSIRASSNFVPVIRLPTHVNNVRGELVQLEVTARDATSKSDRVAKLNKLARQVSMKLAEGVPEWVFDRMRTFSKIKLLSDAPLEWLQMDGFPLATTADISRIPTTPGNLFFLHSVVASTLDLTLKHFAEVLVIRAFKQEDPVKRILTFMVEAFRKSFREPMTVRYVDVQDENDLINALDGFSGALAIWDGHGKHSPTDDSGTLSLPNAPLNAWELRKRTRIPPIVVLGACDTHPMSASHVTTANGFLAAGARTVVATSLPIDARASGLFVARLLLRINQLLPLHFEASDRPYRWSSLVSGMQKRQYMTDIVFAIAKRLGIKADQSLLGRVSLEAGGLIDTGRDGWLEALIRILSEVSSMRETEVRDLIQRNVYLTDALIHVQLGSPEHILIHKSAESQTPHESRHQLTT